MKQFFLLFLLSFLVFGCGAEGPGQLIPKGDRVDATEIDGYFINSPKLTLAQLKGKVVVLDFWATWCGPCRMEIPSFVKLSSMYGSQGLKIIGLSVESPSSQPAGYFGKFLKDFNMNYPVGFASETTIKNYAVQMFPTTFFVDKKGKVALVYIGLHPEEDLNGAIEKLLAE